jgi:hypothetical protein
MLSGRQILKIELFVLLILLAGCGAEKTGQVLSPDSRSTGHALSPETYSADHTPEPETYSIDQKHEPETYSVESPQQKCGIEVESIRLTAAGHMLDFRYRVLQPEKAAVILSRKTKPYLIDQANDKVISTPPTTKIGPLRQTTLKPTAGRTYFMLFSNPGGYIKQGSKVTVVIGDFRGENLIVQ